MLAIEVVFLTGRYVATAYNTRAEGEWPPHPARLFSALVATHCAADPSLGPDAAGERAVLEWLEQQGAPQIRATEATARDVVTVFVPGNDPKTGEAVLPEGRGRQPRTFPSVTPHEPAVTYIWPDAEPGGGQRVALDRVLARVVRLGHSSSLVAVRSVEIPGEPTWIPSSSGGTPLRVCETGQLAALERAFTIHREVEPRVMPARHQLYTRPLAAGAAAPVATVFGDDWLVLRRVGGPHVPMTASAGIARQLRRALMSFAHPIPEVLSGHTSDRRPSEQPHMAVVPLPFVGHANASGLILGVALILPRAVGHEERKAVFTAVSKWEATVRVEDEETPALPLHLGDAGEWLLERVEWGAVASTLTAHAWCHPCDVWSSVTPVALDQNPGDLRSRDSRKLLEAIAAAEATILKACERIGLPQPLSVEILPAAPWALAAKARHYPRFPEPQDRTQRVLTHARLTFDRPIAGPVILGAGRYVGLGLFRPERGA